MFCVVGQLGYSPYGPTEQMWRRDVEMIDYVVPSTKTSIASVPAASVFEKKNPFHFTEKDGNQQEVNDKSCKFGQAGSFCAVLFSFSC